MERRLIKVLFNIYQTCGRCGFGGGGGGDGSRVILWGKQGQMLQLLKEENHENTI